MSNDEWRLCLLGNFRLEHSGRVVTTFARRRHDVVLAYLALAPDRLNARWTLAHMLWPEHERSSALNRLAEVLVHLGKQLDAAGVRIRVVDSHYQTIQLDAGLRTDVQDFDDLLANALREIDPSRRRLLLEEAVQMFGHGLLPMLEEPWVEPERQRLTAARDYAAGLLASAVPPGPTIAPEIMGQYLARGRHMTPAATPGNLPGARPATAEPSWVDVPVAVADAPESTVTGRALAEASLQVVEGAAPHLRGPERTLWLDRLDTKRDGIYAAIDWALDHEDSELALRLTAAMWRYWYERQRIGEGRLFLDRALMLADGRGGRWYAAAAQGSGGLAVHDGDLETARRRLQEALTIWREVEDAVGVGTVLDDLGIVAYKSKDLVAARRYYSESLAVLRQTGEPQRLTTVLRNAALAEQADGHVEAAEALLRERLELGRVQGDRSVVGWTLLGLIGIVRPRDGWPVAEPMVKEAQALFEVLGDLKGLATCMRMFGYAEQLEERHAVAAAHYQASLTISRTAKDQRGIGESLRYLASAAEAQGDLAKAIEWNRQAALLLADIGDWQGVEKARAAEAELQRHQDDVAERAN